MYKVMYPIPQASSIGEYVWIQTSHHVFLFTVKDIHSSCLWIH